jgi:ABC-2 type transport system permease protein
MISLELVKSFLLRNLRLSIVIWAVMGLVTLLLITLFPNMPADDAVNISTSWPPLMKDIFGDPILGFTDVYGWLNLEIFHMTFWIVFGVYCAIVVSRVIAKEIEEHTMDILLSYPIRRTSLIVSRLTATAILLAVGCLLTLLCTVVGLAILGMPIRLDLLAATLLSGFLLCLAFGSVALLVSVWLPQQMYGLFITIGVMLSMFVYEEMLTKFLPVFGYLPFLSFFHFYKPNEILIHGSVSMADPLILLGYFTLLTLLAAAFFRKRDIPV